MPELPEVESVKANLADVLKERPRLLEVRQSKLSLRKRLSKNDLHQLRDLQLDHLSRWGKYLFFHFGDQILLSHMGMSGRWKIFPTKSLILEKHDHIQLHFSNGISLVYHDPRRFGWVERVTIAQWKELTSKAKDLTLENVDSNWFASQVRNKQSPIKSTLLAQDILVGLGNIYVSEILFRSQVRPTRKSSRVTPQECEKILKQSEIVLNAAIRAGGSTIRSYQNALGNEGGYQKQHLVYGKEGQDCVQCGTGIQNTIISGRSSFWCSSCQK